MLEQWEQLHNDPRCTPTKPKMKKTQSAGIANTGASVLCSRTSLMIQLGLEQKKHHIPITRGCDMAPCGYPARSETPTGPNKPPFPIT
jgi:hypothetical protein